MSNRKCFVIGPMNPDHLPHLHWLANDVIKPILGDEFDVSTPDAVGVPVHIMNQVIRSADRSTFVVADMTGNNPNVLYEIAILDAMGRLCIPIKMGDDDEDKAPFDRAAYTYFTIEKGQTEAARKKLTTVIKDSLKSYFAGDIPENPLTNFFGFPLSTLSSAHGLARAYFNNFVLPLLKGSVINGPRRIRNDDSLQLECIIPDKIVLAERKSVDYLKKNKIFSEVILSAHGRKIEAHTWNPWKSSARTLVDIPTVMSQLRQNVQARLGTNVTQGPENPVFRELEIDEISQFVRYLKWHKDKADNYDGEIARSRLRIVNVEECSYPEIYKNFNA